MQNEVIEKIVIPLDPRTKKNHQQVVLKNGRPRVVQNTAYRQYERDALYFLKPQGYNGPLNIRCLFYMKTRRKVDLTNLLAAIDDILVGAGTIEDDNCSIVIGHDGSRVFYDKENPRTEVYIERMNEEGLTNWGK